MSNGATQDGSDTPPRDPFEGTAYRLLRKMGEGGMAEVFDVQHRELGHVRIRELFEAEKAHVGTVSVEVDRQGAALYVDEKPAGNSPLFVEPGKRTIEARLGTERASQTLEAEPGKDYTVKLELGARSSMPDAGQPSSITPPSDEPRDSGRSLVPVFIGAGVTAVAATLAIVFATGASSDSDEIDRLLAGLDRNACNGGAQATDCAALRDVTDSQNSKATGFAISASVGAVAALATVGYLVWPELAGSSEAAAQRTPWRATGEVTERGALFIVSGDF